MYPATSPNTIPWFPDFSKTISGFPNHKTYKLSLNQYSIKIIAPCTSINFIITWPVVLTQHNLPWCCLSFQNILTHWGRVTHICVSKLSILGSDNVAWSAPSHYLNQCQNIVNWTPRDKFQWKVNRNPNIFIDENTFENVVCEMLSILSGPQRVK